MDEEGVGQRPTVIVGRGNVQGMQDNKAFSWLKALFTPPCYRRSSADGRI
jgi:hypothetical protein